MSNDSNDITDEQRKKLLKFVADNRKKMRSVKAHKGDKGECWSLPYMALGAAGVDKPCNSCGDEALYDWGRRVDGLSLAPADIIQVEGACRVHQQGHQQDTPLPSPTSFDDRH
jgi:hypothetical protein